MPDKLTIIKILERARWAPSGDNTQPWRFELIADDHLVVHGFDTRDHVVYDLDGHASHLAIGALLETIRIAASGEGLECRFQRRVESSENHLLIDVWFTENKKLVPDALAPFIEKRVVQRRPMSIRPLSPEQKEQLSATLPGSYSILWFEDWLDRCRMARLMFNNAKIRLNIPEAYEVHKAVIEWGARHSEDKIPAKAVGVDPMTERIMKWAMASWNRIEFLNKWLMGDLVPRIELDLLPGILCAAHFALQAPRPLLDRIDDYLEAGMILQRFWLTATKLGLFCQPEMTPVIFCRYHRQGRKFTSSQKYQELAGQLNDELNKMMLPDGKVDSIFFIGRIGFGSSPWARSTRKPLTRLIVSMPK